MRRFTLLSLLIAVLLAAAPAARAAEEDAAVAARLAAEAKQLLDAGRCGEALPKLDASLTLFPHAKTRFFKAKCLYALDRDLETARDLLEAAKGDPALEQYTADLPDLLLAVEKRLAPVPLVVTVEGGGAGDVRIDGVVVGEAPYRGRIERGRHDVDVVGPGCDPAPRLVETRGDEPILVTIRCEPPEDATVDLKAPDGVLVSVDGVPRGRTPLAAPLRLPPGDHALAFSRRGAPPVSRAVSLASGERVVIDVGMEPADEGGDSAVWAWTTLGTGVALIGVGTAFLVQYGVDLSDRQGPSANYTGDTVSSTNAIVGGVSAGVGAGLVVTSFFLWPDDDDRSAAGWRPGAARPGLSFRAGPDGAAVGYTTRF